MHFVNMACEICLEIYEYYAIPITMCEFIRSTVLLFLNLIKLIGSIAYMPVAGWLHFQPKTGLRSYGCLREK